MKSFLYLALLVLTCSLTSLKSFAAIVELPHATSMDEAYDNQDIIFKKEIITKIVNSYRPSIIARYGQDVNLQFFESDAFQMLGGHKKSGELVIQIFAGALVKFNKLSMVSAICHELGHILGSVTTKQAGNTAYHSLDSVEGEADYFSGSCARKYFEKYVVDSFLQNKECHVLDQGCNQAIDGARDTLFVMYQESIDENVARGQIYQDGKGINPSYPDRSCRLLSMISGVLDLPRPSCWYNPEFNNFL